MPSKKSNPIAGVDSNNNRRNSPSTKRNVAFNSPTGGVEKQQEQQHQR